MTQPQLGVGVMSVSESAITLMGRVLIAWFFLSQAVQRVTEWDVMVILVQMKHVPFGTPMLVAAVVAMIAGGICLLIGFQTQISALLLSGCTMAWAYYAHDFWQRKTATDWSADYLVFALAIALTGGLLAIAGLGGGRFAIDSLRKGK